MTEPVTPITYGPLASVLEVRRGPGESHTGGLAHREALVYALGKAAELEHLVMLQYLFAAFSLKQTRRRGADSGDAGRGQPLAPCAPGDQ